MMLAPRVAWAPLSTVVAPQHQASGGESRAGAQHPHAGPPGHQAPTPARLHQWRLSPGPCPCSPREGSRTGRFWKSCGVGRTTVALLENRTCSCGRKGQGWTGSCRSLGPIAHPPSQMGKQALRESKAEEAQGHRRPLLKPDSPLLGRRSCVTLVTFVTPPRPLHTDLWIRFLASRLS